MKKLLLIGFILADLAVIFVAAIYLYVQIKGKPPAILSSVPAFAKVAGSLAPPHAAPAAGSAAPAETSSPSSANPITAPTAAPAGTAANSRKILFTYRNSKPKKVMIRADFTGWRAEAMEKDAASGSWKYTATLEPGEYAYCFSVDNKSIRDPANKHTKLVGKTVVSSIVVQPAPAAQ